MSKRIHVKINFFFNDSDSDKESCNFYNLVISSEGDGPYFAMLKVENILCKFEIDTGSKLSVISKNDYDKKISKLPLRQKQLCLKSYTGDIIETIGYILVNVRCGDKNELLHLHVIKNGGPPLMGRTWINRLKLNIDCHNLSEDSMATSLRREFPEVFAEGLGTFKTEFKLYLKNDTPVFVKARSIPIALRKPVEEELERLQRDDVIYKVERSDYGTPIVPVIKSNGNIRLCGDYKITINPLLKDYHYPLPRIEDLFAALGGVDSSAYGLGAVLTQRDAEGRERPLCCASRTLNAAELNYSQLDKEALAIVFGVTKHHNYLYGRYFTIRSDHRPLSYIFGKNKGLPVTAASRIQRYAVKLAAYNFGIEFVTSTKNCFADALSRLPLKYCDKPTNYIKSKNTSSYLNFVQENFPISFKEVRVETMRDALLSKIYGFVLHGWPTHYNYSDTEKKIL
ncbi:uncharacterized protein LOC106715315 [Papilio machaon]|uniref:uncharacterized protein LOC106715315 n=1 Tax=Papilio machaon TaxID=76193 RepID=UPI001E665A72|nr:uncharacterized protein LOC106715315 [Papilio machaon]